METSEIFGGLEAQYAELASAVAVVLPVPYDETSTWGKGADNGPAAIIEASANMELYDIETDTEIYKTGIYTAEAVTEKSSPEAMVNAVEKAADKYLKQNKFLVGLGGEHSVTTGFVRAYARHFDNLSVLQLDAHTDLRPEYQGSPYSHASVMSRVREICPFVQVGIRSMDIVEKPFLVDEKLFLAEDIYDNDDWMEDAVDQLTENVFITIDLDVFDPSIMPSTGTPEPGGLYWYQVIKFLRRVIEEKNVVGFDVVELAPVDDNKAPDFLAAKLIYKLLTYKFQDQATRAIK
ncbi:MAG TPA: agmatinase [Bacteroidales bacterium]|nr:agmatinase [Bacteroidales bacterium]